MQKKLEDNIRMENIKISAISYLNTAPFIYGLRQSGFLSNCELTIDYPSACAEKLIHNKVDIGIVPVAIIPLLKNYNILTNYCIGAINKTNSVMLYSEVPLNAIKNIYLDYQSRSSVALLKIITAHYWHINPNWIPANTGYEQAIKGNTAGLIIGDRTFNLNKKYPYAYDLAAEWYNFTKLPFVFACWVANKELPKEFITAFSKAIKFGIDNKTTVINDLIKNKTYPCDVSYYLNECISYEFDEAKKTGMNLFLNYL